MSQSPYREDTTSRFADHERRIEALEAKWRKPPKAPPAPKPPRTNLQRAVIWAAMIPFAAALAAGGFFYGSQNFMIGYAAGAAGLSAGVILAIVAIASGSGER